MMCVCWSLCFSAADWLGKPDGLRPFCICHEQVYNSSTSGSLATSDWMQVTDFMVCDIWRVGDRKNKQRVKDVV